MKPNTKNKLELTWHSLWYVWATAIFIYNPLSWWSILAILIMFGAASGFRECWKKL